MSMIEILQDMKTGTPLTLSTGRGKRIRLDSSPALIGALVSELRRRAQEQLDELSGFDEASEPAYDYSLESLPIKLELDKKVFLGVPQLFETAPAPESEQKEAFVTVAEPSPESKKSGIRATQAGRLIKAYFEHAESHNLKCWYVSHQLRQDLIDTGWEEVVVEEGHRIKVCGLPVYPIHSFMTTLNTCVAEGDGWRLVSSANNKK